MSIGYGPCRVEGCTQEATYKKAGWCPKHYARNRRTGSPTGSRRPPPRGPQGYGPCCVEGCEGVAVYRSTGWCKAHYQRNWRNGHPDGAKRYAREMPDRYRRILELCGQGVSTRVIAEALKVHERTVQRVRRDYGTSGLQMHRFTPEEVARIEAMLDDGCSYSEIGRTVGRHERTISNRWPGRGWTKEQAAELKAAKSRTRKALREMGDPRWKDL